MNTATVTLAAIVLVPVIVLMVLRINAALVFLSLCLGDVLVQFVAKDTTNFLTLHAHQVPHTSLSSGNNLIKLALLLLPAILTAVFMIRTIHGHAKLSLNVLPAIGTGLLGALLIVPLLSAGLSHNILNSSLWSQVTKVQDLIVGASAVICLFVLWLQRPSAGHKHGKRNKA